MGTRVPCAQPKASKFIVLCVKIRKEEIDFDFILYSGKELIKKTDYSFLDGISLLNFEITGGCLIVF